MTKLAGRIADRLLSVLAPEVQADALVCVFSHSTCVQCSSTKSRRYDWYDCGSSYRRVDRGCDSC